MKIEYRILNSFKSLNKIDFAIKFQFIYSTSPWNEWKICSSSNCNKYWGKEDYNELCLLDFMHCSKPVKDYWSIEFLLKKFEALENRDTDLIVAIKPCNDEIIGFCWGYDINHKELIKKLKNHRIQDVLDYVDNKVSYLSEIAVIPDYREIGIARNLFKFYINQQNNDHWIFTQTKSGKEPSVSYNWFNKIGFKEVNNFNQNSRVVQFSKVSSLIIK